jgi:hypothetical protein
MTTDLVAVDLTTGEVLEQLDQQPPELLAKALAAVDERLAEAQRWREALAGELRRRLKLRQTKFATFGDFEVEAATKRSRKWDADGLEAVLRQLEADGVIRAGDWTGLITREPTVSGKTALELRGRLDGDALAAVDETWTWTEKAGPLTVTRSVQLIPEEVEQASPAQQPARVAPGPDSSSAPAEPARPPRDPWKTLDPEELFA